MPPVLGGRVTEGVGAAVVAEKCNFFEAFFFAYELPYSVVASSCTLSFFFCVCGMYPAAVCRDSFRSSKHEGLSAYLSASRATPPVCFDRSEREDTGSIGRVLVMGAGAVFCYRLAKKVVRGC